MRLLVHRTSNYFVLWNGKLFRAIFIVLRLFPKKNERTGILRSIYDSIGHWDAMTSRSFVTELKWGPIVHSNFPSYENTRDSFPCLSGPPKYHTKFHLLLTNIFHIFLMYFSGSRVPSPNNNTYIFVCIEHLTASPIAAAEINATSEAVI